MGGNASGIPVNYNGNVYQSYRGPVFPLTAAGEIGGVTAERNITLDFSPYETQEATLEDGTKYNTSEEAAIITDTYTFRWTENRRTAPCCWVRKWNSDKVIGRTINRWSGRA